MKYFKVSIRQLSLRPQLGGCVRNTVLNAVLRLNAVLHVNAVLHDESSASC